MRASDAQAFLAGSTRYVCDSGMLQDVLDQSAADLHALRVEFDRHTIVGAGIPWFCAPFGRDALITAYEALTLNPDFATESLRTLAAFQGKTHDPETEEEPGKIFHELRFGEMARAGEIPHTPYYGSIDATPLFVIVAEALHRFAGDMTFLRELRPSLEAALGWIDARSEKRDDVRPLREAEPARAPEPGLEGLARRRLVPRRPQAPSRRSRSSRCRATAPTRTPAARSCSGPSARRRTRASTRTAPRSMRELINRAFWMPEANRYAYAIDGRERVLPTVVSNIGHLLWSRVAPQDRATATAHTLLASSSFSGFGIRTLAADQPVYNPLSYHNGTVWPHDNALIVAGLVSYGLYHEAMKTFDGLSAAMAFFRDRRLPELFCGIGKRSGAVVRYPVACSPQAWASAAPLLLVQSILGIEADAPHRRLVIRNPRLPRSVRKLEIHGMRVGGALVSVSFRRANARCHVDRLDVTGGPLKTEIQID